MKIDGRLLRRRRMELGLTSREVANTSRVSSATIKRLEETGDAGVLAVSTLVAVLDALSLTLFEAIDTPETPTCEPTLIEAVGGYLAGQKRGVPLVELAQVTSALLPDVEDVVTVLEEKLREVGMCLKRSSTGLSIVPIVQPEIVATTASARARYLANLNTGDLSLLYRIYSTETPLNGVAQSANLTMSLQKLEGAGLVEMPTNEAIRLTERAVRALN